MIKSISGRVSDIFVLSPARALESTSGPACMLSHKCHSERREESLIISAAMFRGNSQRGFPRPVLSEAQGLNMTEPLYGSVYVVATSPPVRRRNASRYFADVFSITSFGRDGAGGALSQSSVSR